MRPPAPWRWSPCTRARWRRCGRCGPGRQLDRLAAGAGYADGGLVIADALGEGIHPEVYSERWRTLTAAAGLPPIRLHAVRHTLALMLHRGAVAPADAAAMLGHTVGTHLTYYVPKTERGAAAARVGELLAAAGGAGQ